MKMKSKENKNYLMFCMKYILLQLEFVYLWSFASTHYFMIIVDLNCNMN